MNITLTLFIIALFVLLTPGILLRLPKNGNKWTVALVHGLIFALILQFTMKFILVLSVNLEGMADISGNLQEAAEKEDMPSRETRRATLSEKRNSKTSSQNKESSSTELR